MNNAEIHTLLVDAARKYKRTNFDSFDSTVLAAQEFISFIESISGAIEEDNKGKYHIGGFSLDLAKSITALDEMGIMIYKGDGSISEIQRSALAFRELFYSHAIYDDAIYSDEDLDKFIEARSAFLESLHKSGIELLDRADSFETADMIDWVVSVGLSVCGEVWLT